jgi:hypothetical protein
MTSQPDLLAIRASVDRMGRLSDNIFRVGPLSVGLDGVLSWIPAVGELYSAGAAVFLIGQGLRARVDVGTLVVCGALMTGRTVITAVPFVGPVVSDVLTMHKWSARLIVAAIDRKLAGKGHGDLRSATVSPALRTVGLSRA